MELLQLKYFCDAAKTQNFSKTAKKYSVPTSNISQTVHRLEEELEVKLFNRSPNKIVLNDCGKIFYEGAKKALTALEEAKTAIHDTSKISGEIKILICTNRRIITSVIEAFRNKYPDVSFIISHSQSCDDIDFDILIGDMEYFPNMQKTLLITEDISLAMRRDNDLAFCKNIRLTDLANERFVTMPDGSSQNIFTNKICQSAGFTPNIAIRTDDPSYLRKFIELGMGIALIPTLSWEGMFSDNVVLRNIGNFKRNTYIYIKNNIYISQAVDLFFNEVIEFCEGM